jgi:hypothetical protein
MTDSEALDIRMALNMASIHWGDKATEARKAGKAQEAQSCEDIRAEYGALWDRLFKAEHGVPFAYEATDKARAEAMSSPDVIAVDKCGYVGCSICAADNT